MVGIKDMQMPKSCALCERFLGACQYTDFGDYKTERNPNCPLVEIEPLTDTEKRLFLSAIGREEEICKKIDCGKELRDPGVKELTPAVLSIRKKVVKALWA